MPPILGAYCLSTWQLNALLGRDWVDWMSQCSVWGRHWKWHSRDTVFWVGYNIGQDKWYPNWDEGPYLGSQSWYHWPTQAYIREQLAISKLVRANWPRYWCFAWDYTKMPSLDSRSSNTGYDWSLDISLISSYQGASWNTWLQRLKKRLKDDSWWILKKWLSMLSGYPA